MLTRIISLTATIALAVVAGCNRPRPDAVPAAAATIVDSILPIAEEIRRFKLTATAPAPGDGAPSRDALARQFAVALERSDTAQLRALVVSAYEFIELYYPRSRFSRPPYRQSPETLWFLMQQNSEKGISRALARFGGRPSGFAGVECPGPALDQGQVRLWERCLVTWRSAGEKPVPTALFGTIVEMAGRYKFLSYANGL